MGLATGSSVEEQRVSSDLPPDIASKKMTAGLLGILIGGFGIHKFVLGYQNAGLIMLLVSILTCGFGAAIMGPIGLIEGILYLTKSDEEFYRTYILGKKEWF
jgi:TM2 domain-containing membrane protein YozV